MKMVICKRVSFDAAHFLPGYPGKCQEMHGHHWRVELGVVGGVMEEHGFVVDFSKVGSFLEDYVVSEFDHSLLNDKIENPTAENIVSYIKSKFDEAGWRISGDVTLAFIRVWETPDSYAEFMNV